MIGDLKYEEILSTSKELEECSKELIKLIEVNDAFELKDLASTVEGYSKYLTTLVELNKDADIATKDVNE
jgi:hypothetical protein